MALSCEPGNEFYALVSHLICSQIRFQMFNCHPTIPQLRSDRAQVEKLPSLRLYNYIFRSVEDQTQGLVHIRPAPTTGLLQNETHSMWQREMFTRGTNEMNG